MSMPVTTFSAGAPAAPGLFTGKAATGGTDFMAVLAAMTGTAGEPAAETGEPDSGQDQQGTPEPPAAPQLNTVSPFRNHLSEDRAAVQDAAPAVTAETAPTEPDEAAAPAPAGTDQATTDQIPEAPAMGSIPAVLPVSVQPAVPVRAGQRAADAAAAETAAAPPVTGTFAATPAPAAPLEVLAAMAGRPAADTQTLVASARKVIQQPEPARPQPFTVPEAVAAAPADTQASPSVQAAPVPSQPQTVQGTPAAQPVHAPAHVQQPLHTQLAKPMFTLAAAGNGEHVMTMKVTPEDLGTVTVRAVIGPEGVRMELFAGDAARDAVKAIMPELRRELAGAGLNASLDLGTGARPETSGGEGRQQREARTSESEPRQGLREQPPAASQRMFTDRAASLDVLA